MNCLSRIFIYTFIFLGLSNSIICKDKLIDSLRLKLKTTKSLEERGKLFIELSSVCDDKDIEKYSLDAIIIGQELLKTKKKEINRNATKILADAYNNRGYGAQNNGNILHALKYYNLSLYYNKMNGNKYSMAALLNNIGLLYGDMGNIPEALTNYYQSLNLKKEINDSVEIAYTLNNIASIHRANDDVTQAISIYKQSGFIFQKTHDSLNSATIFNNIGLAYMDLKKYDSALIFFDQSLVLLKNNHDKIYSRVVLNIGYLFEKINQIDSAMLYYNKSIMLSKNGNSILGLTAGYARLASLYYGKSQFQESILLAKKSYDYSCQLLSKPQIINSSEILYLNYKGIKNYTLAEQYYNIYVETKDSLNSEEAKKQIVKQHYKYEFEKKESQLKAKQETETIMFEKKHARQQLIIIGGILFSTLVLLFSFFLIKKFRLTRAQGLVIKSQKQKVDLAFLKLHEKNKEVLDSIIYARRIQRSLLTPERYFSKILNKPS